jgi:hypothetical protein
LFPRWNNASVMEQLHRSGFHFLDAVFGLLERLIAYIPKCFVLRRTHDESNASYH